jgi:hypothetical protein
MKTKNLDTYLDMINQFAEHFEYLVENNLMKMLEALEISKELYEESVITLM